MPFSRRGQARANAIRAAQQHRMEAAENAEGDEHEGAVETADLVPISSVTRRGVTVRAAGMMDRQPLRRQPQRSVPAAGGDTATLLRRLDALAEQVALLRGHTNVLFATTTIDLPLFAVVPATAQEFRDLPEDTVPAGTKCRLSYPQRVGALGIEFMQLHVVGPSDGSTQQFWVPVAATTDTDPSALSAALGVEAGVFFDEPFTNTP
jgi:hypothetical protein